MGNEYGPSAIRGIFKTVNAAESAVRDGGIVGDQKHGTGYHRSRNALKAAGRTGDYSIQDPRDKQGDGDAASAADLTMSDVLMRKLTARLVAAMKAKDPRLVGYLREFGGTLDSRRVTAYRVEDQRAISFDSTHLWHIHLSIFRKYANDAAVCQGIAQVLLGIPLTPFVWDGKSFPGAERFQIGSEGAWVTYLGQRLVAHGYAGYTVGPGPTFTTADQAAVKWFQEKQGWTGSDADGFPGPETWKRLAADPVIIPVEPSHPELYPTPKTKDVYQGKLVSGQQDSDSVWQLQAALRKLGFDCELTGAYDARTIAAVKRYQSSLGDKVVDGLVGPLQTARIFKDAGVDVTIIPIEKPAPAKPGRFTVSMREWGGNAGRTLIQGADFDEGTGLTIVHQADDVAGQAEQDIVIRFHRPDGTYIGAITVKRAGHGSTIGVESLSNTRLRFWMGHADLNCIGYVEYEKGQRGTVSFTRVAGLPRGDVSIDQDNDLLCLRTGNRYRGYSLSAVKAGKAKVLWDFTIPVWGKRFQGHLVKNGKVYVHRDVATKGSSRAHVFDTEGNPVTVRRVKESSGRVVDYNWIDTTKMGDEAEGFLVKGGWVHIVKRTGNTGPGRIIEVTPWVAAS